MPRDTERAMSQENVELVRQGLADFGGDPAQAIEGSYLRAADLVAADVEIDFTHIYPDAPILRGLEAWREFVRSLPWQTLRLEPERFFDVDDERVLVFTHVTALGEGSHVPVEMRNAHEFTLRNGKLVRWRVYGDRAEALEAAGLSE
jgi:ketosteroid isomerase-like protein